MKYYKCTTEYACGIDLHTQQMYICLMDREGNRLIHTNVKGNDFDYFLRRIEPYRHDLTVCAECCFNWYWLADACEAAGLKFVLAHALYMKLIHGGKNKNDRIDSEKIAHLLRSNLIPPSYVYPRAKRPLRALLRQRITYVWRRAELLARLQMGQMAEGHKPVRQSRKSRDPWEERLMEVYDHPLHQFSAKMDLDTVRHYDQAIYELEKELSKRVKAHQYKEFTLLKTVPGIGRILGLTIVLEIDRIDRFPTVGDFLSFCRLVKGSVSSSGKFKGLKGAKMGNPYLRWAFGEAAIVAKRDPAFIGPYSQMLTARHGKFKGNAILANKLARATYFMLRNGTAFDPERLVATSI